MGQSYSLLVHIAQLSELLRYYRKPRKPTNGGVFAVVDFFNRKGGGRLRINKNLERKVTLQ